MPRQCHGPAAKSLRFRDRGGHDARAILRVRGHGTTYGNREVTYGDTLWDFDGQEIFKKAVMGMCAASEDVMRRAGVGGGVVGQ